MNILSILPDLTSLADQLIEDKDKKAEYAFKLQELAMQYQQTLITTKTSPKVDAGVKLLYAISDIGQKLWRPALSGFAFIWGLFNPEDLMRLHELGTVGDAGIAAVFGSAPAWGYSRHVEKQKKGSAKAPEVEDGDYED